MTELRHSLAMTVYFLLATTIASVRATEMTSSEVIVKAIVQKWSDANSARNIDALSLLYTDEVSFYGTTMSKEECLSSKKDFFQKNPSFIQSIQGEIKVEKRDHSKGYTASFTKQVVINGKTQSFPSYLVIDEFEREDDKSKKEWKIVVESDEVTDGNLLKQKRSFNGANLNYGLPKGAFVLETQSLNSQGYPERLLILWMLKPTKHPRGEDPGPYTCPEETRGSHYSGPTRVSLFDSKGKKIINTIRVVQEYFDDADSFNVPYRIHAGSYYHVGGVPAGEEGKPTIMWLKDYNGDGKSLEFALFHALACMGLPSTLIGYSPSQDKVIQYLIHLKVKDEDKQLAITSHWCDYLFSIKPSNPGVWKYEIDYRGRGGSLDKYTIRYKHQTEDFQGELVSSIGE
ncbi:hypothetical protein HYR99_20030 [Candidatus Poribacteria bacterium]|nr:hypothetical protein [Candidatus Poribacteria bacterium]